MKRSTRIVLAIFLMVFLSLSLALPARAFEERIGEGLIIIEAGEVVEDDVYAAAETVIVDGVIKGDLVVGAQSVIINGTVEGDLIAGARDVIINGTVGDDARIFGAAFLLAENAVVGDDLVGAGGSLETRPGSQILGDLVIGSGQNLLGGEIGGDAKIGSSAIELNGTIGGDAVFALGRIEDDSMAMGPMAFGPENESSITIPALRPGLAFGADARIDGKMEYIASRELNVPETVAEEGITYSEPVYSPEEIREMRRMNPTPMEMAIDTGVNVIQDIASLILVGLFMAWALPGLVSSMSTQITQSPQGSLGWGLFAWVAFFFGLLAISFITIMGAIIFGALSLGGLSAAVIFSGLAISFSLVVGVVILVAFIAKVAVGLTGGKLLLAKFNPSLAEHKFWPLAIGIILLSILFAIPVLGGIADFFVGVLGLGAIWLMGREWYEKRKDQTEP